MFCKQPEGFLYSTSQIPSLLCLKSYCGPISLGVKANALSIDCHTSVIHSHPHLMFSALLLPRPHCSLLFSMRGKPTPTSGPLHSQLPLLDCSSPDFQSLLETITSFSFLCREAFPAYLFKTACPPHLHRSQSLSLLRMPFLTLINTWRIKLSLVYSLCPFQKVNIPGRESTLYP